MSNNVISLFRKKEEKKDTQEQDSYEIFMEAMKRNKANREKLRKDRQEANTKVKRNYRL